MQPTTRRRPTLALSLLLALAAPVLAQRDAVVERLIELGRTDNRVMDHLTYLAEGIGSRLTGSTDLHRAERWAVARFSAWGLDARLERWGEFPVGFERRFNVGAMVRPHRVELVFGTPAWTPGTPGPVRARAVLEPEDPEELAAAPDEFAGCWLVRRSRGRGGAHLSHRSTELAKDLDLAGEVRDGGEPIRFSGRYRVDPEHLPELVSVRLRSDQFLDLVARLEDAQEVELELDVDNRFLPGPVPLYNVVADIPGTDLADEYVIVGGHSDSWDGAEGAQDNGTGMATSLEAARLLMEAGARPRRTIRFMFWSGEEQGLLGSRAWVEQNTELLDDISAVLVHDGGTNVLSGLAGPPALVEDLRWATEPLVDLDPQFPFAVRENQGLRRRGDSDHSSFIAAGVPGFFWKQGGAKDDADYEFVHHTQYDTLERVRPRHLRHSAVVVAVTAYNLAMLDGKLSREGLFAPAPRRMGVFLDDTAVTRVLENSRAAKAGVEEGDVILAVDGHEVSGQRDIVSFLQQASSKIAIRLLRGEQELEIELDYSDDPDEAERLEQHLRWREHGEVNEEPDGDADDSRE